jgi:hypothetical protein
MSDLKKELTFVWITTDKRRFLSKKEADYHQLRIKWRKENEESSQKSIGDSENP